jgi:5-methylcytosine-specific restriction endonuclease McrA
VRSATAKENFRKVNACPSTGRNTGPCPGYEVDHVTPLACGGADSPGNMQWLSTSANRSKDSRGCKTFQGARRAPLTSGT